MATEWRAGHILVLALDFVERVRHGRIGYRGVYGRVM